MRTIVSLSPGGHHRSLHGHPWVFANEVQDISGSYSPGDIVEVRRRDEFVGLGYINPKSQILVRLLTRRDEEIDSAFIRRRVGEAVKYRQDVFKAAGKFGQSNRGYRLVYSEADFLPGLIVDLFGGYVSFQTLTLGMERWKDVIVDAIREFVAPRGIFERNDAPVREIEGLSQTAGYVGEPFNPLVEIDEGGVTMVVDIQKGQKTGYFLDQSANRLFARGFMKGKNVLDAFSYSGGFGLSAAVGDAEKVLCVDISPAALDLARASAQKSGVSSRVSCMTANVFDLLHQYERDGVTFDAVFLDPPAFARSRKMVEKALSGYKEINLRAMRIISSGGILCTSSCSQHVTAEEFDEMLARAASDAGVALRFVERRGQRADHPILAGVPETNYLKFRICQVLR